MRERTMDGLAAARARGRTGGQKPKLSPRRAQLVGEAYNRRDCTFAEIAADFGVTRQTVYRALKKNETGGARV
jgi:DNA invertase Pin-like site-specific DNA recombinase